MRTEAAQQIGFGGSCHWCTEAVFASLQGVSEVTQGWFRAGAPDDAYSEAVALIFDPQMIPLHVLTEIHLLTHSCTSQHSMRGKYRSAVYCFSDQQRIEVEAVLTALQRDFDEPLVTRALMQSGFRASPPHYQEYYQRDPLRPFCQTRIAPKLARLQLTHGKRMRADWPRT